jgi:glycerophosphoryl diester phosphodiesterase
MIQDRIRSASHWLLIIGMVLLIQAHGESQELPGRSFLNNGVTAHRGFSAEHPENTLPAFQAAIELGCDWVECDACLTKDQKLVVIQDETTGRVGDKDLRVAESTYEELQTVDVAFAFRKSRNLSLEQCPPARIPLLAEVLDLVVKQQKSRLSIQARDEATPAALELVHQAKAEPWVGFNGSDLTKLAIVKQFDKTIPVFWDRGPSTDLHQDAALAKRVGVQTLMLQETGCTADKAALLHEHGFEAGARVVNDPGRMKQLLQMGFDRLCTDSPDLLLRLKKLDPLGL